MNKDRAILLLDWLRHVLNDRYIEQLAPASSDASFRSYFRISSGAKSYVVMDAPPDKEDIGPWISINQKLRTAGLSTPEVFAEDRAKGFILMSDLGSQSYLSVLNKNTVNELYSDALAAISRMQSQVGTESLPLYDSARLHAEMNLFAEWFLDSHLGIMLGVEDEKLLSRFFEKLVASALEQPQVFVHRDFHSRNLMRLSFGNPGIIDFQDAVKGPITYDLVSLLRDCYIEWPVETVMAFVDQYRSQLTEAKWGAIDGARFRRWFDWMGLQRHLKVLGIFCRLYYRDGKAQYLNDLPLTLKYVLDAAGNYEETKFFSEWLIAKIGMSDITQARVQAN